jgi:hypothetical protein
MSACRRYIRVLCHDNVDKDSRRDIESWRDDKPDRRGLSVLSVAGKYYGLDGYGVLVSRYY